MSAWVEEILSVYFLLRNKVESYSCPPMEGRSQGGRQTNGMPGMEQTFVLDVGAVVDVLPLQTQRALECVYGLGMSQRATARSLKMHHEALRRRLDEGVSAMTRGLKRRNVRMPWAIFLRYC